MIGFKPATYQNIDEGDVIKIIQVTKNNAADVEEWVKSYGHEIIHDEDFDDELFVASGENSKSNYFEVDVRLGMFLAVDSDGLFYEFEDFSDYEDEWTRMKDHKPAF